jgi:hypothetical protein
VCPAWRQAVDTKSVTEQGTGNLHAQREDHVPRSHGHAPSSHHASEDHMPLFSSSTRRSTQTSVNIIKSLPGQRGQAQEAGDLATPAVCLRPSLLAFLWLFHARAERPLRVLPILIIPTGKDSPLVPLPQDAAPKASQLCANFHDHTPSVWACCGDKKDASSHITGPTHGHCMVRTLAAWEGP